MSARILHALVPSTSGRVGAGLLVLRVIVGYALHLHGLPKMHDPLHWLDDAPGLRAAMPPTPAPLQALVAVLETYGSLLLIAGALTPLVALLVVCDLGTASIGVGLAHGRPFVGRDSFEIPALLGVAALVVLVAGPGRYSLDALLARYPARR